CPFKAGSHPGKSQTTIPTLQNFWLKFLVASYHDFNTPIFTRSRFKFCQKFSGGIPTTGRHHKKVFERHTLSVERLDRVHSEKKTSRVSFVVCRSVCSGQSEIHHVSVSAQYSVCPKGPNFCVFLTTDHQRHEFDNIIIV